MHHCPLYESSCISCPSAATVLGFRQLLCWSLCCQSCYWTFKLSTLYLFFWTWQLIPARLLWRRRGYHCSSSPRLLCSFPSNFLERCTFLQMCTAKPWGMRWGAVCSCVVGVTCGNMAVWGKLYSAFHCKQLNVVVWLILLSCMYYVLL